MMLNHLWLLKYPLIWYFKLLRITCRFGYIGLEKTPEHVIVALWHQNISASLLHKTSTAALFSSSKDGQLAHDLLTANDKIAIKRQKSYLKTLNLLKEAAVHKHLSFTIDGGHGPIYQCKPGVILTASKLGLPIVPFNISISRKIIVHSAWDKHQIPLPFSTITYYHGEPLWIPPKISREEVEKFQRELEQRIHALVPAEKPVKITK